MRECVKWGKTAFDVGVQETLAKLPTNNTIHVVIETAKKLRDLSIAHTQTLNVSAYSLKRLRLAMMMTMMM